MAISAPYQRDDSQIKRRKMTEAMADKKTMLAGLQEALWTALDSCDYRLISLENLAEAGGMSRNSLCWWPVRLIAFCSVR